MEKITLTEDQLKAFKSLERAYKKCKESGIVFYSVLETLHAVNGVNIDEIASMDSCVGWVEISECVDVTCAIFDSGFDSYTDDTHLVKLK